MKKTIFVLVIVLVLAFMFTLTASATQPTEIGGYFYFVPPYGENDYCITTWDGSMDGCVDQPASPGLAAHGTIYLTVLTEDDELSGSCEYNLRTYDLDGIARFVANRCTGELAGFHLNAVGWGIPDDPRFGTWEGSYHFKP